jgi:hypothetical protein
MKKVLIVLAASICFFTVGGGVYIDVHYSAVMPGSPQPSTGRIYRMVVNHGYVVYVNKRELEWADFFEKLTDICGVGALLFVLVGACLGWFKKGSRWGLSGFSGEGSEEHKEITEAHNAGGQSADERR